MDEENFADGLSFVPYVIHVGDALDVEDTVEVKPTLPVPMVFDEVDRGGPDEVVDVEEEQARWGPEKMKNQPTRQKRIHLQKSHSSMGKQLVSKVDFKSQKKENKKHMVDAKTNKEVVNNKDVEARRKNGELAETKTMVERLLEDKMRLKKENEALRKELEMKIKNKMEMERKRSKAIMELSRLSSQQVEVETLMFFLLFKSVQNQPNYDQSKPSWRSVTRSSSISSLVEPCLVTIIIILPLAFIMMMKLRLVMKYKRS